jgi:hypothetical protein
MQLTLIRALNSFLLLLDVLNRIFNLRYPLSVKLEKLFELSLELLVILQSFDLNSLDSF